MTVSLDTLRPERMVAFARSARHAEVLEGIAAAKAAGDLARADQPYELFQLPLLLGIGAGFGRGLHAAHPFRLEHGALGPRFAGGRRVIL